MTWLWTHLLKMQPVLTPIPPARRGGSGPNDKGLSRKHIIEGTKVQIAAGCCKILENLHNAVQHSSTTCCGQPFKPSKLTVSAGGVACTLNGATRCTQAALKRMDQEYVDLVFAHRPDHETPIEETVGLFSCCLPEGSL